MNALYFAPGACSFVPHVALEKIKEVSGQDYEPRLIKLHKGEQKAAEFLAMNPDGQVPVLMIDASSNQQAMTQIVAICEYLDRQCPQAKLLPSDGMARSQALSLMAWMNNSIHPTFTHVFMPHIFTDDAEAQAKIKSYNVQRYKGYLQRLDALAASKSQLWFGNDLSLLDAYAFTLLRWGGFAGLNPADFPHLKALVERALAVPAMATIAAREKVALDTFKG